jgi:hypothetical protein
MICGRIIIMITDLVIFSRQVAMVNNGLYGNFKLTFSEYCYKLKSNALLV